MNSFRYAFANERAEEPDARPSRPVIGELLSGACELGAPQLEQILEYQRKTGMRFGEAAVALRLVDRRDVLEALYEQFQYTPGYPRREGRTSSGA